MKTFHNLYSSIISVENLFIGWEEFRKGKRYKPDIQHFERHLEDNLFFLHNQLKNKTYRHSKYTSFYITDPKLRHIHKATVRDRVVHHATYRILYPIFDRIFVYDSYSCRVGKGTHRAVKRLVEYTRGVSINYTRSSFALKCDIKKFFDSVDHEILLSQLKKIVEDPDTMWLLKEIIYSFSAQKNGNLTLDTWNIPNRERERERVNYPARKAFQ